MPDNKDVLQSIGEALEMLNDNGRAYLIGFSEGVIAARQAQAGA